MISDNEIKNVEEQNLTDKVYKNLWDVFAKSIRLSWIN